MEPEFLKNEYVEIYARGTGARNHNTSVVQIDKEILLDHGLYRGLHLIVLSRKNLSKVYSGTYDLMLKEKFFPLNKITTDTQQICQNFTLVKTIKGDEGKAAIIPGIIYARLELGWTTLVLEAEYNTIKEVP